MQALTGAEAIEREHNGAYELGLFVRLEVGIVGNAVEEAFMVGSWDRGVRAADVVADILDVKADRVEISLDGCDVVFGCHCWME